MGVFKNHISTKLKRNILINLGFEEDVYAYTKVIRHNFDKLLYITVYDSMSKINLYDECDCGERIWERNYPIPQYAWESEWKFVEWVDKRIDNKICMEGEDDEI